MSFEMTMPYERPDDAEKVDIAEHYKIEQFLFREAQALDERRFDSWLAMFSEDLLYEAPARYNRLPRQRAKEWSGAKEAKHFEDTKEFLRMRVRRLKTDKSWSEDPPSRTRHLISNVQVSWSKSTNTYLADSNFVVYRARASDDEETFYGARHDLISPSGDGSDGLLIQRRTILFDHTVILAANLGIFF